MFLEEYKIAQKVDSDPNKYFNLLYNLRQRGRHIVQYVKEAEHLFRQCLLKF